MGNIRNKARTTYEWSGKTSFLNRKLYYRVSIFDLSVENLTSYSDFKMEASCFFNIILKFMNSDILFFSKCISKRLNDKFCS